MFNGGQTMGYCNNCTVSGDSLHGFLYQVLAFTIQGTRVGVGLGGVKESGSEWFRWSSGARVINRGVG